MERPGLWFCVSWELRARIHSAGAPKLKSCFSEASSKPGSFVLDPGEGSLFLLGVSLVLRLAHGNTWISTRRDIKDGYSCIICIIVSMTKSTEFIHSQDVFFLTPSRREAEKVFYWSSAKLQNQVHPEGKFSVRLAVFQPGGLTSKPLTFWTVTTLLFFFPLPLTWRQSLDIAFEKSHSPWANWKVAKILS